MVYGALDNFIMARYNNTLNFLIKGKNGNRAVKESDCFYCNPIVSHILYVPDMMWNIIDEFHDVLKAKKFYWHRIFRRYREEKNIITETTKWQMRHILHNSRPDPFKSVSEKGTAPYEKGPKNITRCDSLFWIRYLLCQTKLKGHFCK